MKNNSFNKLASFDSVLTRIDPALEIDVFNKFMRRLPAAPKSKASNENPLLTVKSDDLNVRAQPF